MALEGHLLGRRADRHHRHRLEHPFAAGTRCPHSGRLDLAGTLTFGVGLTVLLAGITYGVPALRGLDHRLDQPLGARGDRVRPLSLVGFCFIELRVESPMVDVGLFRSTSFGMGNLAGLMSSMGRGGLQFMSDHLVAGRLGFPSRVQLESTPLWAGCILLPITFGFLVARRVAAHLSDRFGARPFTVGGMLLMAATFLALVLIPVNFNYWVFAILVFLNGLGGGIFTAPNTAAIMSSVPATQRGAASGVRATFFDAGPLVAVDRASSSR